MKRFAAVVFASACLAACSGENSEAPAADAADGAAGPSAEAPAPAAAGSELAAAEMEGPRPGKWRIAVEAMGQTMPATETCIEQTTFADMQETQQQAGVTCSENTMRREGRDIVGHSVCTIENMTITSDTRISGDFNTAYTMEVTSKMDPAPMPSMAETKTVVKAERLGDC
jgi:hypothetical protein